MEEATFDVRLKHPSTMIIAGQTGSGKTFFTNQLLFKMEEVFSPHPPSNVILFYKTWQKSYESMKRENLVQEFIQGMPEEEFLKNKLIKNMNNGGTMIIFDDLMSYIGDTLSNCFTVYSHHYNTSVVLLIQSLFLENKAYRICSLNAHYIVLMKNKRDGASVSFLARQIAPYNTKYITQAYVKATEKPYSHLLFDLRQETNELIRVRSNIFSNCISIFIDAENKEYKNIH